MEIYFPIRIVALICSIALFLYTIYLIRSDKLSAHLAISWIITELLLIIVLCIKEAPAFLSGVFGEQNSYAIALFVVVGWIITLMLDTLTRVSELAEKLRSVIQENALLREKMERLEKNIH